MKRLAVDIGGTFTDLVYIDGETGEIRAGVFTTSVLVISPSRVVP